MTIDASAQAFLSSKIIQELLSPTCISCPLETRDHPNDIGWSLAVSTAALSTASIRYPIEPAANWLSRVQRRINYSLQPSGREQENHGQWLTPETAAAANAFFQLVSDVLPGEPHIYSSSSGDELIAEFKAPHGVMNAVISPKVFVALAVLEDGEPVPSRLEWTAAEPSAVRGALRKITQQLRDGEHGRTTMGT